MTAVATPLKAAAAPAADELRRIPLAELHESPLNPRTFYRLEALQELKDSLLSTGQLTPIIVRPRKAGGYEIAAGHRRYRAAKLACETSAQGAHYRGLEQLAAIVRELDDRTFIEVLNIENLQRDDLHPLEEATGFRQLMEKAGYDVAKIAARIGRSTKYVYDRIKLLQLVPEAKTLFLAGEFEAGHAVILARLSAADQRKAIDKENAGNGWRREGLFLAEIADPHPDLPAQERLKFDDRVKPVSVREFQKWVDDHIRFQPARDADPMLFPDTVALLKDAADMRLKVVAITHDYRVPDDARDEQERTYGEQAWQRADGRQKSKTCDHWVTGIVVAGPGRGDAFKVCVAKHKCKTHWPEQFKAAQAAKKRAKAGPAKDTKAAARYQEVSARQDAQRQAKEKAESAERDRWGKAVPALAKALAAKIKTAPAGATSLLGEIVLSRFEVPYSTKKAIADLVPLRRTADDIVRRAGWLVLLDDLNGWRAQSMVKDFTAFGIDAQKIVDQISPKPAPEKKPAKTPAKKQTKKGAAK